MEWLQRPYAHGAQESRIVSRNCQHNVGKFHDNYSDCLVKPQVECTIIGMPSPWNVIVPIAICIVAVVAVVLFVRVLRRRRVAKAAQSRADDTRGLPMQVKASQTDQREVEVLAQRQVLVKLILRRYTEGHHTVTCLVTVLTVTQLQDGHRVGQAY